MPGVHSGPVVGLITQVALLGALSASVGLGSAGWVVGLTCALVTNALLARGMAAFDVDRLGPADRVTLVRVSLACGVAALTAESFTRPAPLELLVSLSAVALLLDAVDGIVARRTGTASAFGARYDGEADAFLMLVLSVYVAPSVGLWVLAIGAARYAFLAAGWALTWMRGTLPPRHWRKVVAAVQGVALAIAAAAVLPTPVTTLLMLVALALLTESFGRDVLWLWIRRSRRPVLDPGPAPRRGRLRAAASAAVTGLAGLLLWGLLVVPNELDRLSPVAFARIPVEALVVVAAVVLLPRTAGAAVAVVVGVLLALVAVATVLDLGFTAALGRPFDPAVDWTYAGSAVDLLADSLGRARAVMATAGAGVGAVAVLVLTPLAVLRLTRIARRHRTVSLRAVGALGVVWVLLAVVGLQVAPGTPIASAGAAGLAIDEVDQVYTGIQDQQAFARASAADAFRDTPGVDLLAGLRGKDVLVVFVESYGRVAVQDSAISGPIDALLDAGTTRLKAAGYDTRSAFLTSPTFGGISWLAHSTLQSGLWIDSQRRYDALVASDRTTLATAFGRAGWRTVVDVPPDNRDWPQGTSFYHYDTIYDSRNVGYRGPKFSYAPVPDQFTLATFRRLELAPKDRGPVMAEIDLVSSHTPWTPLPRLVGWDELGDGSVYDGMPEKGPPPSAVWPDPAQVQAAYGRSIQYSVSSVLSFLETYRDPNLVVVLLGDHQPSAIVSGQGAGHDVPITVIAQDPKVIGRISSWGWDVGMRPLPDAPVWPMDSFRDRFLRAYGSTPEAAP